MMKLLITSFVLICTKPHTVVDPEGNEGEAYGNYLPVKNTSSH